MNTNTKHKNWITFINSRVNLSDNFLNPLAENLIGVVENAPDLKSYHLKCNKFFNIRKDNLELIDFLKKLKSNELFGKLTYEFQNDINLSLDEFLNGCSLFYLYKEIILKSPSFKSKDKLKILEIGPGYGEFANLFISLNISRQVQYDLIDLKENLQYSEIYLNEIYGNDKNIQFNFIPADLTSKTDSEYDLIINTYSFQEMMLDVVKDYFGLISQKMTDNSFFFSINTSFKWDVKDYSYYDYHKYFKNICSYSLFSIHNTFYSHNPQLCIFKKLNNNSSPDEISKINRMGRIQEYSLDQLLNNNSNLSFDSDLDILVSEIGGDFNYIFKYFDTYFIKSKTPVFKIKKSILEIMIPNINKNYFPDRLLFQVLLVQNDKDILKYFKNKYGYEIKIDRTLLKKTKRYIKRVFRISI